MKIPFCLTALILISSRARPCVCPRLTVVVNYNDLRTAAGCYAGLSYSTDSGATWHEEQPLCAGHGTNFGDPIVV